MIKKIGFVLIFALVLILGCTNNSDDITGDVIADSGSDLPIIVDSNGKIPAEDCSKRGLDDKVIFLVSAYCPHCKDSLPGMREAADENDIDVVVLDASKKEDMKEIEKYGIIIKYTPTLISKCNTYIGGLSKDEYDQIFKEI